MYAFLKSPISHEVWIWLLNGQKIRDLWIQMDKFAIICKCFIITWKNKNSINLKIFLCKKFYRYFPPVKFQKSCHHQKNQNTSFVFTTIKGLWTVIKSLLLPNIDILSCDLKGLFLNGFINNYLLNFSSKTEKILWIFQYHLNKCCLDIIKVILVYFIVLFEVNIFFV